MPRKKIIYVYFTILANFMILVVLEIISYGVGMGRTTLCCCYFLWCIQLMKRPVLLVFKFPVAILESEKIKCLVTICHMEFSLLNMENMWDHKKWS